MKTQIRRLLLRLVLGGLAAASLLAPAGATPLPAVLQPVVVDGAIPPGAWDWLRGGLADATAQQRRDWAAIETWLNDCMRDNAEATARELAELGIEPSPDAQLGYSNQVCIQASSYKAALRPDLAWPEFSARMGEARRVLDLYLFGANVAMQMGPYDPSWTPDYGWDILRASQREQVIRKAMSWHVRTDAPQLDAALLPYLQAQLSAMMAAEDHTNTEMLERIVAEYGWPRRSTVGERAAGMAWLLAQHADHDPAFQLRVLRLMEPLVATREVSPSNYAYLYDRTMLKLVGRQRYGTQFGPCEAGVRQLRPLEPDRDLAADRAAMELQPMEEYRAQMDRAFGPCPG